MNTRFASRLAAVAAAALIGVAGIAIAQPSAHGPHGGGDVVMTIAALKGQLNLDTSQQAMWDSAAAAGQAARGTIRANMQKVHDALTAELAKPEPDLAAVAAAADAARTANAATMHQVRDAWLNLYGTFSVDQKSIVKAAIQKRMARAQQFRERMQQRRMQRG